MLWDIFCKVIDNHGDIGVCWRLSVQLAGRGERVRLWVDDASALRWMAPAGHPAIQVLDWSSQVGAAEPGAVVIEAFGCELELQFQAAIASAARVRGNQPCWINLEYLTAEPFAARNHGLPSPVLAGPAAGLTKHFYYPGFTAKTGGLLREEDLLRRQGQFDRDGWLRGHDLHPDGARLVSLFCYEPPGLDQMLSRFAAGPGPIHLLVTAGRAADGVRAAIENRNRGNSLWNSASLLRVDYLPHITQPDFDHLLWACDFNFVRGEDSLVRALWAGKNFVWHIYPQHDDAHRAKLSAFLDWAEAPPDCRAWHLAWNGFTDALPAAGIDVSPAWVLKARQELLAQDDLVTQLVRFVAAQDAPLP